MCKHYYNMISELIYFNSLTPACSQKYWEYFFRNDGLLSIANYTEVLAHRWPLKIVNKDFYDL
jgi:hypothetical protein